VDLIKKYFPELEHEQLEKFAAMYSLYGEWNQKLNLISRRDFVFFYERHVLHSLGIAATVKFPAGSLVLDAGTGGGFPGIPLAIFFPEVNFHLVDSIAKKIKAVENISLQLDLKNISTQCSRVETLNKRYNYIVSRAVAPLQQIIDWTSHLLIHKKSAGPYPGLLYLKGGDVSHELKNIDWLYRIYDLKSLFSEPFFETKMLIHLYN
jgi:16S rRNA (guanine527-N7)-methyltransferase